MLPDVHPFLCLLADGQSPVLIRTVSLNGRATVDDKPATGIRFELHRAITFNREERWQTGLWDSRIIKFATTDASGLFTFGEILPGRYWLLVAKGSMNFAVEIVNSYGKAPYKRLWYKYYADGCEDLLVENKH
jgi:hypothetical protein